MKQYYVRAWYNKAWISGWRIEASTEEDAIDAYLKRFAHLNNCKTMSVSEILPETKYVLEEVLIKKWHEVL